MYTLDATTANDRDKKSKKNRDGDKCHLGRITIKTSDHLRFKKNQRTITMNI